MEGFLSAARTVLAFKLLDIGSTPVTVGTLLTIAGFFVVTIGLSALAQRLVARTLRVGGLKDEGTVSTIASLARYFTLLIGTGLSLQLAGINVGSLFTAGAVLAVGLAFAMQTMAQNFVAGIGLLMEQTIKPGHIIEVDGLVSRVMRVGIRASVLRTRDGEDLIVPNTTLVSTTLKNFTLDDAQVRMRVNVGVLYRSDIDEVITVLEEVAGALPWRTTSAPQVILWNFGDNAIELEVAVWITDPWEIRRHRGDLNRRIWRAFRDRDIVIAFPQMDVHFDAPVMNTLAHLGGRQPTPAA